MVKYGDSFKEIKRKKDGTKKATSIAELKGVRGVVEKAGILLSHRFPFALFLNPELLHPPQMFDI
jgi:hypothetical protein